MATKTAMRSIGRRVNDLTDEITELDRQLAGLLAGRRTPWHYLRSPPSTQPSY